MSDWSNYITDLRRLLHDSNDRFWTLQEKTDYINRGRQRVVRDTGCNRVLTTGYLSPNVEVYNFGGVTSLILNNPGSNYNTNNFQIQFSGGNGSGAYYLGHINGVGPITSVTLGNQGTGYTSQPTPTFTAGGGLHASGTAYIIPAGTFDMVDVYPYWSTNYRQRCGYRPWSVFSNQFRSIANYLGPPRFFSVYNNRQIYLAPIPDQAYKVDWDCVVEPADLAINDTAVDSIPFPYHDPVSFYAAFLAKQKEQKMGEADAFQKEYVRQAKASINSSFTRRIP